MLLDKYTVCCYARAMTSLRWGSDDVGEVGIARHYVYPDVIIPTGKRAIWEAVYLRENAEEIRYYVGASKKEFARFLRFIEKLAAMPALGQKKRESCVCATDNISWQGSELEVVDGAPNWGKFSSGSLIRLIDLLAISNTFDDEAMDEWLGLSRDGFTREVTSQTWECRECNGYGEGFHVNTEHTFFRMGNTPVHDFVNTLNHAGFSPMVMYCHRMQKWESLAYSFSASDVPYSYARDALVRLIESSGYDERILDVGFRIDGSAVRELFAAAGRSGEKGRYVSVKDRYLAAVIVLATRQRSSERLSDVVRVVGDEDKLRALVGHMAANAERLHLLGHTVLSDLIAFTDNDIDTEMGMSILDSKLLVSSQ